MDDFRKDGDLEEGYFPEGTSHEDEFYYTGSFNFVWDKTKNDNNIREHGVDFKTAALVFNDPYAMEEEDKKERYYERRDKITGIPVDEDDSSDIPGFEGIPRALLGEIDNVLFVVYTTRFMRQEEYFRIISARAALKPEIDAYKKNRAKRERR